MLAVHLPEDHQELQRNSHLIISAQCLEMLIWGLNCVAAAVFWMACMV